MTHSFPTRRSSDLVEHRKEALKTTDDPLALAGELVYGAGPSEHPELSKSFNVSEAYGEVVIPLLSDLPFARRLEIEGAYRYSDYSTVGSTHAWKAGGMWSPVDGLSFRGRSEEHTSELQSLMRISYAVFCWKNKKKT